jgi:hypothetical protein
MVVKINRWKEYWYSSVPCGVRKLITKRCGGKKKTVLSVAYLKYNPCRPVCGLSGKWVLQFIDQIMIS